MKELVIDFWRRSLRGSLRDFDFDGFFNSFKALVKDKLSGHCQLTFMDYIKHLKKYYDMEVLRQFEYHSEHTKIDISYENILKGVFFDRYVQMRKKHNNPIYATMLKTYKRLQDINLNHSDKVFLIDRCISLQHNSGFILELDIVQMRLDFEAHINSKGNPTTPVRNEN